MKSDINKHLIAVGMLGQQCNCGATYVSFVVWSKWPIYEKFVWSAVIYET